MKKSVLFILTICIMAFYACTEKEETNPFLTTWRLLRVYLRLI